MAIGKSGAHWRKLRTTFGFSLDIKKFLLSIFGSYICFTRLKKKIKGWHQHFCVIYFLIYLYLDVFFWWKLFWRRTPFRLSWRKVISLKESLISVFQCFWFFSWILNFPFLSCTIHFTFFDFIKKSLKVQVAMLKFS